MEIQNEESRMIAMLMEEKNIKQRQIMDIDTVDDDDLMDLIRQIKDEPAFEPSSSSESQDTNKA